MNSFYDLIKMVVILSIALICLARCGAQDKFYTEPWIPVNGAVLNCPTGTVQYGELC